MQTRQILSRRIPKPQATGSKSLWKDGEGEVTWESFEVPSVEFGFRKISGFAFVSMVLALRVCGFRAVATVVDLLSNVRLTIRQHTKSKCWDKSDWSWSMSDLVAL